MPPDPAPAASPSAAPASPAPAPGSLTGTRYDAPISDQAFDRLGPQEQSRYARVRDQNNNPTWQPRSDRAPDPAKPTAATGEPASPVAPVARVTDDGKLRIGEGETSYELSADDVRMLMAQKAASDLRATQVPAMPEAFELKLPEGFKLPEGVAGFKFNEADPALRDLKTWAHGKRLDQQTFSEMLSFYASSEVQKEAAFRSAQAAEVQKLGANGTSRVTAVETWLRSELGDDLANGMRSMMVTEKIVRGFEKLAAQHVTQGAANFSQAHRAPEPPAGGGRVSDEEYNRMSQAQRWEYARGFDQAQFRGGSR
jgi:hypothetical protein